jgi:hypothetical protein
VQPPEIRSLAPGIRLAGFDHAQMERGLRRVVVQELAEQTRPRRAVAKTVDRPA